MTTMKRLEKLEGFGNVQMMDADIPAPGPDQVLVEVKRSLISRGSELFRRYNREEAADTTTRTGYRLSVDSLRNYLKPLQQGVQRGPPSGKGPGGCAPS